MDPAKFSSRHPSDRKGNPQIETDLLICTVCDGWELTRAGTRVSRMQNQHLSSGVVPCLCVLTSLYTEILRACPDLLLVAVRSGCAAPVRFPACLQWSGSVLHMWLLACHGSNTVFVEHSLTDSASGREALHKARASRRVTWHQVVINRRVRMLMIALGCLMRQY